MEKQNRSCVIMVSADMNDDEVANRDERAWSSNSTVASYS
jgi:hypothetical protein